jgi:cation diffusion facilitator CzcD-associated flavoprotein CzcO
VVLVKAGVSSFTENGCIDEFGEEHLADIIICATGFNTSFIPRFPVIGSDGKDLKDLWSASNPESYMGIGVSNIPNFLMFLGPYSAVANGPTMSAIGKITLHG